MSRHTRRDARSTRSPEREHRGFTLLVAIILASVALSLGLALMDVAYKQVILASSSKQSQYAFYAADAGLECALFWHSTADFFGTNPFGLEDSEVLCDGTDVAFDTLWEVSGATTTTRFIAAFDMNRYCAAVSVYKGPSVTLLYSNGYDSCDPSSPRRVERGIKARF